MKKIVSILAALCLLLTGCVGDPKETDLCVQTPAFDLSPVPGKNADNRYLLSSMQSFHEAKDFYCGSDMLGEYLYFYDKASGISGILCADPSCNHDSRECAAYIETGASLNYYDGQLYWIGKDPNGADNDRFLWRSDISGSNREKVLRLDWEKVILAYQPQQYVIHRDCLYILGGNSHVDGVQAQYMVSLLAVPLDGKQEPSVLYQEKTDGFYEVTYRFVGNTVYVEMVTKPSGTENLKIRISRCDTQEKIWEQLYEEKDISAKIGRMWVTEQGDIYLPGIQNTQAYIWKLDNGSRQQTAAWDAGVTAMPILLDEIAVQTSVRNGIRWLDTVSFMGERLYSGALFPNSVPGLKKDPSTAGNPMEDYSMTLVGGDRYKLIVTLENFLGSEGNTLLLDLTEDLKTTVLWSNEKE